MFEKEAEEAGNEKIKGNYQFARCARKSYKDGFKDGAEFGYNKALEWHKQSNDDVYDLIAEDWSVKHFICVMKDKNIVTAIGSCDESCCGDVSVNLFFDHDDEKYYLDDIVWWKEIVLPKEIKENE